MIFEKLREFICDQFAVDEDSITEDTAFIDDLDADSLDIVELTMVLEEEFNLPETPDEVLPTIKTVGDLLNYIENNMNH